jgi:hypothetical protein
MLTVRPTTFAGAAALLRYAHEHVEDGYLWPDDLGDLEPEENPRIADWLPSFEEFGRFIDAIDVRQENLFRFTMLALNTWARPEAIIDFRADKQINWSAGLLDLTPPHRRQTKKFRPQIRLTDNLTDWLRHWKTLPQRGVSEDDGFSAPMVWDGPPVTTMKKTFKRHAVDCGLPNYSGYHPPLHGDASAES